MKHSQTLMLALCITAFNFKFACAQQSSTAPTYKLERLGENYDFANQALDINDSGDVIVHAADGARDVRKQILVTAAGETNTLIEDGYSNGPFIIKVLEDEEGFIMTEKYYNGATSVIDFEENIRGEAELCPSIKNYDKGAYKFYLSDNSKHAYLEVYGDRFIESFISCANGKAIKPNKTDSPLRKFSINSVANDGTVFLSNSFDSKMWAHPTWPDKAEGVKDGNLKSVSPNAKCFLFSPDAGENRDKAIRNCGGEVTVLPSLSNIPNAFRFIRVNDRGDVIGELVQDMRSLKDIKSELPKEVIELHEKAKSDGVEDYTPLHMRFIYTFDNHLVALPRLESEKSYLDKYSITAINMQGDMSGIWQGKSNRLKKEAIVFRRQD